MTATTKSRAPLFIGGLLVGALLATVAVLVLRPSAEKASASPPAAVTGLPGATEAGSACDIRPIVERAGAEDGEAGFSTTAGAAAIILKGKEAAASGRDRDAEAAFLAACRLPAQDAAGALLRADAKYNLARHYANLAQEAAAARKELEVRAARLLEESLAIYQARLPPGHEKLRFAAQALAALRDQAGAAALKGEQVAAVSRPSAAREPDAAPAQPARAAKHASPAASVPAPAPAPAEPPTPKAATGDAAAGSSADAVQPSFDCGKARSIPEKLICGDPELARLDRELGQVYARARDAATDRAAFQRVSDREWRRREAECRDRACLLDWYAQRRAQLLAPAAQDQAQR